MPKYPIVTFPDPRLRDTTSAISYFNKDIDELVNDMLDVMYDAHGVGLAGPQIGISKKIAVIDVTPNKSQQLVLINPEIIKASDTCLMHEGCLSVPGFADKVPRANQVTLKALDNNGQEYILEAEGLLAECIQHEIDHLNGRLYIDYLSRFKRDRIKKKLEKIKQKQNNQ